MARRDPCTADLKHRVTVCTSADVVTTDGALVLTRTKAWDTWAMIEPHRGSMFSREGYAIREGREQASHRIVIRLRPSVLISSAAWLYEARRISAPRWFKILDVKEIGEAARFWEFTARETERSDEITAPADPAEACPATGGPLTVPLPSGVKL